MDGSLLDLSAEMVESELEDYWHELFKVQKLILTKLKKAKADTANARRISVAAGSKPSSQQSLALPPNTENTLMVILSIQAVSYTHLTLPTILRV